ATPYRVERSSPLPPRTSLATSERAKRSPSPRPRRGERVRERGLLVIGAEAEPVHALDRGWSLRRTLALGAFRPASDILPPTPCDWHQGSCPSRPCSPRRSFPARPLRLPPPCRRRPPRHRPQRFRPL